MASTSSNQEPNAFSGIEPPNKRRKIEESSSVYDVFINHRGPDVKHTLAIQLYDSLKDLDIKAFLDSEEKTPGISFPSTIEAAIRSASVHIAIFSNRYAESAWCLVELVLMLQSAAKIFPVFYQVKPSDLRHIENGAYAHAFLEYQKKGRYLEKLKEWKEALQQVSYTAGYEFETSDSGDYKDLVSAVEKEVHRKKPLPVAKYPVGLPKLVKEFERRCLDELVQDFESRCGMKKPAKGKANVFGIFGMGGVGKTTLSLELFNQKISKYTRASFLYDVREAYAKGTLPLLQSQLVKDIFSEGNRSFPSNKEGTRYLRDLLERSSSLSFLIVLDDIDHVEQLDALLPMDILNKHGNNNHLVIITTRDVRVLVSAGIDIAYNLRGLDREDGRELFCLHAFNRPQPDEGYEDLAQAFVTMCGGLPLSLIVLSRHVSGRAQWYWQDELEKVRKTLPGDVKKNLKISFDALDNEEKQIFMDIACFYINMSFTKAMSIWEGSGWRPRHALETLKEKCLVEEVELIHLNEVEEKWEPSPIRFVLRMHDHLRDLGREMADELSHPRRLWNPKHLQSLESKGFQNVLTQTKGRCFHSFLDKSIGCEVTYILGEPEDSSVSSLQWLQLEYQSQSLPDLNLDIESSLPSWIPLEKLQCLRISNGCFRKLWESNAQVPSHLKELQIQNTFVEEFPDFSGKLDNMKKLVLHAKDIQTDIWSWLEPLRLNVRSLKMSDKVLIGDLAYNDTEYRTNFNSLVINDYKRLWEGEVVLNNEGTVMSKVEDLEIQGCRLVMKILINGSCCQHLQSLKLSEMKNLVQVDLWRIRTLKTLEISGCEKFKRLSEMLDLSNLMELKISKCPEFEELRLTHLSCLKRITIENCYYLRSVSGICNLAKLVELKISRCGMLEFEYFGLSGMKCLERVTVDGYAKMEHFELDSCEKLREIMFDCKNVVKLSIRCCAQLDKLADLIGPSFLKKIIIDGCGNLKYLRLNGLENLESVSGNLELRQMYNICLDKICFLEQIEIDSCEKIQHIILPTSLIKLSVQSCRVLQRVAGPGDLPKLTQLIIKKCPALEELPSIAGMSNLEKIEIDSIEELEKITLSTRQFNLSVEGCWNLQRREGILIRTGYIKIYIIWCPKLDLRRLRSMSCLEEIEIAYCKKLENIVLPTTLVRLSVKECGVLQGIAGIADLVKLTRLCIYNCPKIEELPLARLDCLEEIEIECCEKLQNITLPTTLFSLSVKRCRVLQGIAGVADLVKLTRLCIFYCPELEESPNFAIASGLEKIEIESCEKLQNITLPTTLFSLSVKGCGVLQGIAGIADLVKLTRLCIYNCPELEELPNFARVSSSEEIEIEYCEKLQNITLPTTLFSLSVKGCRVLRRIAGIADLVKLTRLCIYNCPELEELRNFDRVSGLEEIEIECCEKLQNITLPTTLFSLSVKRCGVLRRIAGLADVTVLRCLCIADCPELELPCLGRLMCLERIEFDSCENLQNISAIEEFHVPEYARLTYCGYAVTQYFISRWKCAPRRTCLIGKAVDGAESSLNKHLFFYANIAVDGVIEISNDDLHPDLNLWSELGSFVVICLVVIHSSTLAEYISDAIARDYRISVLVKMRQGESIIAIVERNLSFPTYKFVIENLMDYGIMKKGYRVDLKKGEEWKSRGVLDTIVNRLFERG